ncbi:MAG: hypothetical protein SFZ24_11300 [Planctomycetota bacterium]|nr:hypothetical protein [Planctomycetota bacterium]
MATEESTSGSGGAVRSALAGLHVGVLGVWAGTLLTAGLAAALAFPRMRALEPTLGVFAGMREHHWSIAAGHVANPLLSAVVVGQAVLAGAALATFVGARWRGGRVLMAVHGVALGCACLLAAGHAAVLQPAMARELEAYWSAARAGDDAAALPHKEAFDALHPAASRMMIGALACTLAAGVAGCVRLSGERRV